MPFPQLSTPGQRIAGALFLVLLFLVVWGSLMRNPPPAGGGVDKLEHFGAYAGLTALAFGTLGRRSWLAMTGVAALGGGVEALQAVLPTGRVGSFADLAANVAGALSAWLVWTAVGRFRAAPARSEP